MYDYDALVWLALSCAGVRVLYLWVDHVLANRNPKYARLPVDRKMYIQKNLVKSTVLAFLCVVAVFYIVVPVTQFEYWDNYAIHRIAVVYVSNDVVGLICVDKLPMTTRIHHIITTSLVVVSLGIDFATSDIGQAMVVYTCASATAYIVNFHLGVRWLCARDALQWLRYSAAVVYVCCCGCSWSWHIHWLWTTSRLNVYHALYIFMLGWIVRDDVILMQWLTT
jgi:hypothetical protein